MEFVVSTQYLEIMGLTVRMVNSHLGILIGNSKTVATILLLVWIDLKMLWHS